MKAGGKIMAGQSQKSSLDWQAKMSSYQADYIKQTARVEEKDLREEVSRVTGKAKAIAGASGFAMDSPSTQDAIDDIVRSGELDAAMIRHRGDIGAWEATERGKRLTHEGKLARTAGFLGAGAEAASAGGRWFEMKG